MKSFPVNFYVQKTSNFSVANTPVPFEVEILNIGGAMNLTSGVFTAPRPGIYHFSLTGLGKHTSSGYLDVGLSLNGGLVGRAHANSDIAGYRTFSLQSTLRLKTGDRIWASIISFSSTVWHDNSDHYTHFTGWLSQEDTF